MHATNVIYSTLYMLNTYLIKKFLKVIKFYERFSVGLTALRAKYSLPPSSY